MCFSILYDDPKHAIIIVMMNATWVIKHNMNEYKKHYIRIHTSESQG